MKKTRNTIAIVILSLISATGIGVYIYHRIKIKRLNEKVTNIDEIQQQIEDLDVTGEITPTDVDPNSQPNIEFDDNGNPIDTLPPPEDSGYGGGEYDSYGSYY
jgi:hypothetical protein